MAEVIQREVGEKVRLTFGLDSSMTKDLGKGTLEAVVTTSSVDRHMEKIDTEGISTTGYIDGNPVVLYGHDYQGLPIGKTLSIKQYKNKMTAKFQLAVDEYPFAKTVYDMVKGGYLNAVSIGGVVRQWSDDYLTIEKMDMVEFSIVPVPANPEALITSRSLEEMTGKSMENVEKEYHQFISKAVSEKLKGLPKDEIADTVKTLENLVGILKATLADNVESKSAKETEVTKITLRKAAAEVTKSGEEIIKLVKKGA